MIIEQTIVPILAFIGIIGAVMAIVNFVSASLYDAKAHKQQQRFAKQPYARRYRPRPLVTILLLTHNDERCIESSLAALNHNIYRKLEIIVVDNCSSDATVRLVRTYCAQHPARAIRLVAKKKPGQPLMMAQETYHQYGHGQLMMILNTDYQISRHSLLAAIRHFQDRPELDVLLPRRRTRIAFTVTGLFCRYKEFLQSRWKKTSSLTGSVTATDLYGSVCSLNAIKQLRSLRSASRRAPVTGQLLVPIAGRRLSYHYAHDTTVVNIAPRSFFQLCRQYMRQQISSLQQLRHVRLICASFGVCLVLISVLTPIVIGYCLYLALHLHEPTMLLVCVALLSIFLLSAIWDDSELKLRQKISYIIGLPVTYGLFYLLSISQIGVLFGAVLTLRKSLYRQF